LRQCNAGREIKAYTVGSARQTPDARAQDALDTFCRTLDGLYGTVDVQINRLFLSLFMRGAICAELVLDQSGRQPIDLAVIDPASVRAKRITDPDRGTVFEYGQQLAGHWVPFDRPTISYIPVDPLPGSPYGRPLVAPALFLALFLIGLLHDLRRVIAQQGYPRYDIEIVLDEALKQMPTSAKNNPAQQEAWLSSLVTQIATYYDALEPESAFAHTSAVKLNRPLGTLDTNSLGAVPSIIEALERQIVRALKMPPFLMGLSESNTETQANRQAEAHFQSIRSVQHLVENQLGHLLTLGLQAQGIVAEVVVEFAENRAAEEQRDEMVRQLKQANATAGIQAGFISQDEGADYAWDKETADQPEPRVTAAPSPVSDETQTNPDPSASRSVPTAIRRDRRAKLVPLGADQPFDPVPDVEITDDDVDRAVDVWDQAMPTRVNGLLAAAVVNGEADG
jgi:hypothetical protein